MRSVVTLASRSELPLTLTRPARTRTQARVRVRSQAVQRCKYSTVISRQRAHGRCKTQVLDTTQLTQILTPAIRLNKLTNLAAHHPPVETCLIAIWYNLVSRRTLRFTAAPLRSIQSITTPRRRRGLESLTEPGGQLLPKLPKVSRSAQAALGFGDFLLTGLGTNALSSTVRIHTSQ